MCKIQTVTGCIDTDKITGCDAHAHLITYATAQIRENDHDLVLDSKERVGIDIEEFKTYGGNLIIEMTTVDYGYDVEQLKALSLEHDVHVVACAGFNKGIYNRVFLENCDIDQVAASLIHDIRYGIGDTNIKPGVLKIGTSLHEISPWEENGIRAISRAHQATGIPISTHTQAGTMALQQLQIFSEEHVPYEHIVLCHLDQNDNYDLHKELIKKGVFLSYDSIAKKKYNTRDRTIRFIVQFAKEGLHKQILVGNDFARRSCFKGYGGQPGYQSVFVDFKEEVRKALYDQGFSEKQADDIIQDIYVENPKRAFAIRDMNM